MAGQVQGRYEFQKWMAATAILLVTALPLAAQQQDKTARTVSESVYRFDIPAQPLSSAIADVGAASGWRIAYAFAMPAGSRSKTLSGRMSVPDAVGRLLAGTGLSYRVSGDKSIVLTDAVETAAVTRRYGDATPLAPIVVNRKTEGATTEGSDSYTADVVTVAGKTPVPLREVPNSVSVLTSKRLADQNLNSVEAAMRQTTGVTATPYGDGTSYFRARGYELDAQYDGMPTTAGIQYLEQFDTAIYDRIEVLRGPAGVLQGSGGGPAGTVNLVRRMPLDHFALSTDTQVGSWNYKRQAVDVTGPLNDAGTVRGRLIGVGQDRDFFYDEAGEWHGTAYGALQIDLTPDTTLSLSSTYEKRRLSPFDYGLSLYTDGTFLNAPRSAFFGADWSYTNYSTADAYANLRHEFDNGWVSETTLLYRDARTDGKYAYMYGGIDPVDQTAEFDWQGGDVTQKTFGIDTNISGAFDFLGHESHLLLGANYALRDKTQLGSLIFGEPNGYNVFTAHSEIPEIDMPLTGDQNRSQEAGLYGQARLKLLDPLTVILGGRLSYYSNEHRDHTPEAGDWSSDPSVNGKFTPYAGIVYDLNDDLAVYASYSSIFTPQANLTFDGSALPPREGKQYEVGVKGSFFDGALTATLAAFNINDSNRAVEDPDHPGFPTNYVAAGKARSRGIEAEVSGEVVSGWNLTAGYTYLNTEYLDDPENAGLVLSPEEPRHTFKFWSQYAFQDGQLDGLTLGVGGRIISSTQRGSGSGVTDVAHQGGYAVVDAQIGYKFNEHLDAALTVKNVFDKTYFDRLPTNFFGIYGEPRSVMVSLKSHW